MPQEIKKIPIVIASILKPVDDTRMFEKLGHSLAERSVYNITIIGYPTTKTDLPPVFTFISFKPFRRVSIERIWARYTFLQKMLSLKPRLIILTTHELLFTSWIVKVITGCRLIYDVQENYYRNIIHSASFPICINQLIASFVRLKEKLLGPAIDHFFLAEKSYQSELDFLGSRYTILENKAYKKLIAQCSSKKKSEIDNRTHLIFSGTLATNTGVFEAIRWTKSFHQVDSSIHLTIIGYCSLPKILSEIKNEINGCNYIQLIGGHELVPHACVLEEISQSDGAFITYPPNPSTAGSIPTKLFEYLALQIPIFLVPHPPWVNYCKPYPAAILLEESLSPAQLLTQFKENAFYTRTPRHIYWEDQETSLLSVIDTILDEKQ